MLDFAAVLEVNDSSACRKHRLNTRVERLRNWPASVSNCQLLYFCPCQTAAKQRYAVTDGDLKKLGSLRRANVQNKSWQPMHLFLESQVRLSCCSTLLLALQARPRLPLHIVSDAGNVKIKYHTLCRCDASQMRATAASQAWRLTSASCWMRGSRNG